MNVERQDDATVARKAWKSATEWRGEGGKKETSACEEEREAKDIR